MKYKNQIIAIIISLMLLIGSLCTLPMLVKVITSVIAILYGIWGFVGIFEKIHKENNRK